MPWETGELRPGTTLMNKYVIGRKLGRRGGFGITYLGADTNLQRRVAIKEHLPRDLADRRRDGRTVVALRHAEDLFRRGTERFIEEGKKLARFEGKPHIVGVYDYFEENGTAYLVMRYLEGETLEQYQTRRKDKRVAEVDAVRHIVAVLDGLGTLHGGGVYHLDVKPANVYLTTQGEVKLLDFGAAKQAHRSATSRSVFWTPGYSPLEQCLGDDQDADVIRDDAGLTIGPWSDVYAAGATLYALLTGVVPPPSNHRPRGVHSLASPLDLVGSGVVSETVSRATMKAMAMMPTDRYQDADGFRKALVPRLDPTLPPRPWSRLSSFLSGVFSDKTSDEVKKLEGLKASIVGESGPLEGLEFPVDEHGLIAGRDPDVASIVFPTDTQGVSRQHLEIAWSDDHRTLRIRDLDSKSGTFVISASANLRVLRARLEPGEWVTVAEGDTICLGSDDVSFNIRFSSPES